MQRSWETGQLNNAKSIHYNFSFSSFNNCQILHFEGLKKKIYYAIAQAYYFYRLFGGFCPCKNGEEEGTWPAP